MRIVIIILIFTFGTLNTVDAQSVESYYANTEEISVDSLLKLHREYNSQYSSIDGYRIQIFKGSGNNALEDAENIIDEFSEKHEDTEAYISFMEPYYRIRIGDYRIRLDALNFLKIIRRSYPSAFVIQSEIELIVLPKYQKTISYEQEDNSRY